MNPDSVMTFCSPPVFSFFTIKNISTNEIFKKIFRKSVSLELNTGKNAKKNHFYRFFRQSSSIPSDQDGILNSIYLIY
jgi:hypothetical protein